MLKCVQMTNSIRGGGGEGEGGRAAESRHIRRRLSGSDKRNVEELRPLGCGAGNAALTHACQHSRQTSRRRRGDPEVFSLITDNCKAFASAAPPPPPTPPRVHAHALTHTLTTPVSVEPRLTSGDRGHAR